MSRMLNVALMLLLAAPVWAQEKSADTVVVEGKRGAGTARDITAARSKVMSRHLASSCNFMAPPAAAEDDVTLRYMSEFGMEDSISNDAERFSEVSPGGDASNTALPPSLAAAGTGSANPGAPASGCGASDRRFAAGRAAIERKDKSLALGFEAYDNQDYARALALFTTAWNKLGYEEAALMLAKIHLYGLGTPKDMGKAVKWLREVTDARFDPQRDIMRFDPRTPHAMNERVEAAFTLARIHERGLGVPRDAGKARDWYAKAADFGFIPALNVLGQDELKAGHVSKAITYFKDATEAGYIPAAYNLGKLYYAGAGGQAPDLKLAGAYFLVAAKAGHPGALFAVGRIYDLGQGVAADPRQAIVYYKEAAVKGNPDAEFALGTYFHEGEQVEKNLKTARQLFDAAARQGQADAMFNLGAMEINGEGGDRNPVMAYVWLTLAKWAGHASADAALKTVIPQLSPAERAKGDAILKPDHQS